MVAEFPTVLIFKFRIPVGLVPATFNGAMCVLAGLLGCRARRPLAVISVKVGVTWIYFVPIRKLPSVRLWLRSLPLGAEPSWWETKTLLTTVPGFAPRRCL
jgi:hypothetical protein